MTHHITSTINIIYPYECTLLPTALHRKYRSCDEFETYRSLDEFSVNGLRFYITVITMHCTAPPLLKICLMTFAPFGQVYFFLYCMATAIY